MNPDWFAAIESAWLERAGRGLVLSARDVERVRAWARAGIPAAVVVAGIEAAFETPPERVFGIDYAAPAVERSIRAWRERQVGGHDRGSTVEPELDPAFDALLEVIERAGRADGTPEAVREVLRVAWRAVVGLRREVATTPGVDPVERLVGIDGAMVDAAFESLTPEARRRIEGGVDAALDEERRFTPAEAFSATRRALLHRTVRAETGLPTLRLRLSRGW